MNIKVQFKKISEFLGACAPALALISILFGFCVIAIFLYKLSFDYSVFQDNKINTEVSAQFGDYIGGFVGAIWSLAGILLFYSALRLQRKEFSLQRSELEEQRLEFASTRIINVIYRQIEKIEEKEKELIFITSHHDVMNEAKKFKGLEALNYISTIHDFELFDANRKHNLYTDVNKYFMKDTWTKYFVLLTKTIEICYLLITQTETTEGSSSDDYLLKPDNQKQLIIIFFTNLDKEKVADYLQAYIFINSYFEAAAKEYLSISFGLYEAKKAAEAIKQLNSLENILKCIDEKP